MSKLWTFEVCKTMTAFYVFLEFFYHLKRGSRPCLYQYRHGLFCSAKNCSCGIRWVSLSVTNFSRPDANLNDIMTTSKISCFCSLNALQKANFSLLQTWKLIRFNENIDNTVTSAKILVDKQKHSCFSSISSTHPRFKKKVDKLRSTLIKNLFVLFSSTEKTVCKLHQFPFHIDSLRQKPEFSCVKSLK